MSSRSSSARPQIRRDTSSSSSSLEGMEKPWPSRPSTPRTPRVESIINMYFEKPLPPTPTYSKFPPSPLSSVTNLSPTFPTYDRGDEANSSHTFKDASVKRSSASRIPDRLELRSHPVKGAPYTSAGELGTRPSLDISSSHEGPRSPQLRFQDIHPGTRVRTPDISKEPQFTEWKAPVYRPPKNRTDSVLPTPSKLSGPTNVGRSGVSPSSQKMWSVMERGHGSRSHAEEYRALIHDVSPESPDSKDNPFSVDSNYQPSPISPVPTWTDVTSASPMSPRISDVLDQPPMPEVLHIDEIADEGPTSSRCSSRASELGELTESARRSFHGGKVQSFRRRPSSRYPAQGMRPESEASIDDQASESHKHHRKSLQQGVAEAYESLHRRISLSSKPKPKTIDQDLKSSVISSTPYGGHGKKIGSPGPSTAKGRSRTGSSPSSITNKPRAHESSPENPAMGESVKFSKPNRANTDLSTRKERSIGSKLTSAFHSGTAQVENVVKPEKSKTKRDQINERREELRRKIMVVLPERVEGVRF